MREVICQAQKVFGFDWLCHEVVIVVMASKKKIKVDSLQIMIRSKRSASHAMGQIP